MKNFCFLCGMLTLLSSIAVAQDVIDIGQDIGKTPGQIEQEKADNEDLFDLLGSEENAAEVKSDVDDNNEDKEKDRSILDKISEYIFGKDDSVNEVKKETEETQEDFIERLERQAQEGDLKTQKALAYMYLYGAKGVEADNEKAFKYYEMAANQGDPIALNNLGSLYFNGLGVPVNYAKAIEMFEQASQAGSTEASLNLGFIYLSGKRAHNNAVRAVELFNKAAQGKNFLAKYMLGYSYYKGFGVEKDINKGASLIKEAADADFDEAQYVIGQMYVNGEGVVRNYTNAKAYLTRSAEQGDLTALMYLADLYVDGTQLPQNLYSAYIMYNIGAVLGKGEFANEATDKRNKVEEKLKMEEIIPAQQKAESFQIKPSELTSYVRKTFGQNIAERYIENNMVKK